MVSAEAIHVEYVHALTHRGDGFTNTIPLVKFFAASEMMGLVTQ